MSAPEQKPPVEAGKEQPVSQATDGEAPPYSGTAHEGDWHHSTSTNAHGHYQSAQTGVNQNPDLALHFSHEHQVSRRWSYAVVSESDERFSMIICITVAHPWLVDMMTSYSHVEAQRINTFPSRTIRILCTIMPNTQLK